MNSGKRAETVEEAAMIAILNATGEYPDFNPELIQYFVNGAKYGAKWQAPPTQPYKPGSGNGGDNSGVQTTS